MSVSLLNLEILVAKLNASSFSLDSLAFSNIYLLMYVFSGKTTFPTVVVIFLPSITFYSVFVFVKSTSTVFVTFATFSKSLICNAFVKSISIPSTI